MREKVWRERRSRVEKVEEGRTPSFASQSQAPFLLPHETGRPVKRGTREAVTGETCVKYYLSGIYIYKYII